MDPKKVVFENRTGIPDSVLTWTTNWSLSYFNKSNYINLLQFRSTSGLSLATVVFYLFFVNKVTLKRINN